MHYLSVREAREMCGLRLVLTAHVPGPWGQAAKAVLDCRNVPYVPVEQSAMADNADLLAWTGSRNAPIAVYNDEPPYDDWLKILMLADRLGTGPSLLPDDPTDRALCLGLSTEICGYWGLGYCRRISMWSLSGPARSEKLGEIRTAYGYRPDSVERSPDRLRSILTGLDRQLETQALGGSRYFIGDSISACDLYWAAFSIMFAVPDDLQGRIPEFQKAMYETSDPVWAAAVTPALIRHRDMVYAQHIGLPIRF